MFREMTSETSFDLLKPIEFGTKYSKNEFMNFNKLSWNKRIENYFGKIEVELNKKGMKNFVLYFISFLIIFFTALSVLYISIYYFRVILSFDNFPIIKIHPKAQNLGINFYFFFLGCLFFSLIGIFLLFLSIILFLIEIKENYFFFKKRKDNRSSKIEYYLKKILLSLEENEFEEFLELKEVHESKKEVIFKIKLGKAKIFWNPLNIFEENQGTLFLHSVNFGIGLWSLLIFIFFVISSNPVLESMNIAYITIPLIPDIINYYFLTYFFPYGFFVIALQSAVLTLPRAFEYYNLVQEFKTYISDYIKSIKTNGSLESANEQIHLIFHTVNILKNDLESLPIHPYRSVVKIIISITTFIGIVTTFYGFIQIFIF